MAAGLLRGGLSDWLMRANSSDQVVMISNDYFRLCSATIKVRIRIANFQRKTGSNAPKRSSGSTFAR
jgi:hypothetical protein